MTKKADTDPNFPPPKDDPSSDAWLDAALDAFAKPQALDHKEEGSASEGRDAVQYEGRVHMPPARVEHNTFPNAPVIVSQTDPGVAPPPNDPGALGVTPEERKRLEKMFEEKRKDRERAAANPELEAIERQADTGPRQHDPQPPGVVTDPPKHGGGGAKVGAAIVALAILALVAFVSTHKTGSSTTDGAPSTTATTSVTPPTTTSAMVPVAPTVTTTAPTATQTAEPPVPTTTATVTARPTSTHAHAPVPPVTTTATATAPAPTATTTSTANPEDPDFSNHMRIEKK